MSEFSLSGFGSYFELLVAFTFAFTGIKSVRKIVSNFTSKLKFTVESLDERYKKCETQLKFLQKTEGEGNPDLEEQLEELDRAKDSLKIASEKRDSINKFIDGSVFKPLFSLTGSIYLFVIILSGYESLLSNKFLIAIVAFLLFFGFSYFTFAAWSFYCETSEKSKNRFESYAFLLQSRHIIGLFGNRLVFFLLTLITIAFISELGVVDSFLTTKLSILAPEIDYSKPNPLTNLSLIDDALLVSYTLLIMLSLIPYLLFYFREDLFLSAPADVINQKTREVLINLKGVEGYIKGRNQDKANNLLSPE